MKIQILELVEGAKRAEGLTVIIDVFRAFSLEAYLFARGVKDICAVGSLETALEMGKRYPEAVKIGERGGKIQPGFDYGNSPSQTEKADLKGRTVIHTTSAGTQGLVNASGADELLAAGLVNAGATAGYILERKPDVVSLVAMGKSGKESAPEDVLCARYIRSILTGSPFDMNAELERLRGEESAKKFFRTETQDIFPKEDYELCTRVNCFDFVLGAEKIREDVFHVMQL